MTLKFKWFLIFLCLGCITIALQTHYVTLRYGTRTPIPGCPWCEEGPNQDDVIYVPINQSVMRLFSPADPDFLADLLWLRTAYYFGQHVLTDRQYPYLLHLLDLITDLAPKWLFPYIFGALVLPLEVEAVDEGIYLIDKGLQHHPNEWQLWFFKGYFLWQVKHDHLHAAEMLKIASTLKNAPSYLANLAATVATKSGQKELTIRFLNEALKNTTDPLQRQMFINKIKKIMEENL
ncbi:MAG: hypothetical protein HQK77_07570 [Desulfobacterales bacterium]|nr:hypothetical protein [Desulfobacterales bacterium]